MWFWGPLCIGHVILKTRSELYSHNTGLNAIFAKTWVNVRRSALKVNRQIGFTAF